MADALGRPPPLRRIPGGWVGFHLGAAWPVDAPGGVALAPDASWSFDGAVLRATPGGGATPAPAPWVDRPPALAAPRRRAMPAVAMPGMRLLRGEAPALLVPRAWLERLVLMPASRPLPFAPPGVLGLALAESGVLLLDGPPGLPLLAVLRVADRLLGLGCASARPDADAGDGRWLPDGAWDLAPRRPEILSTPEIACTALLFCHAGGLEFALPALEVEAVLAPQRPVPGPADILLCGVVAHRGQVLPVLDGGLALGGPATLAGGAVPMLRLAGPVALAVTAVEGLRRVADTAISPAAAGGPVRATCWFGGAAIPVLDPAWLTRRTSFRDAAGRPGRLEGMAAPPPRGAPRT